MTKASEEVLEVKEDESEAKPVLTDREKKLVDVISRLYNVVVAQGAVLERFFNLLSWLDGAYKELNFNTLMKDTTDYLRDELNVEFTKVDFNKVDEKKESAKEEVTATET